MSGSSTAAGRCRPSVAYLAVWLTVLAFAGMVWPTVAGAQEASRGSMPVASSSTVTAGDAFSPVAVVFAELDADVTITVFADRSCDRQVTSTTFAISGLETSGPPVEIDEPGVYYARSQVEDGPLSNCERLVEVVAEPELEVSQEGDTLRVTTTLRGEVTAVLMEAGCVGEALGSIQWRADTRTSQSPPLVATGGSTPTAVKVTVSDGAGHTVTTCEGWTSRKAPGTTTTADPTVQETVEPTDPTDRTTATSPETTRSIPKTTTAPSTTTIQATSSVPSTTSRPPSASGPSRTTVSSTTVPSTSPSAWPARSTSTTPAATSTTTPLPAVAGHTELAETGPSRIATTAAAAGALLLLAGALTVLISRQTNKERGTS
jgi:hypothetical protein